jgi:hypothetical protein
MGVGGIKINKTGSVRINVTLKRVCVIVVNVEDDLNVCLHPVIQHAKRMCCIVLSVTPLAVPYFFHVIL